MISKWLKKRVEVRWLTTDRIKIKVKTVKRSLKVSFGEEFLNKGWPITSFLAEHPQTKIAHLFSDLK